MEQYYVYAIKRLSRGYIHIGLMDNPGRCLAEHNIGKSKTTKPYRPFVRIYCECVGTRDQVRIREKYLKSGAGREFLKALEKAIIAMTNSQNMIALSCRPAYRR